MGAVEKRGDPLPGFHLLGGSALLYRAFPWPVRCGAAGLFNDQGTKDKTSRQVRYGQVVSWKLVCGERGFHKGQGHCGV